MENTFIILLLIFTVNTEGAYKRWLPNANFGNPWNWDAGRKPCGNDKLLIHEESPSIYVQINTTIQEMTLPNDGEIVFGSDVVLAFTNEPDHSAECLSSGSQIQYNLTYPPDWLDPKNWCTTDTETGSCKSVDLLDSEKIPGATDNAVFPKDASYFVNLDSGVELTVNTLKISNTAYTTNGFTSFMNTREGRLMFPVPSTGTRSLLHILRRRCTDPTGCYSGNDVPSIMNKICKYRSPHCPRVKCLKPIRPAGSCCEICGGVLKVTYGTGFTFADLRDGLKRTFLDGKPEFNGVTYIVSKLANNTIQILLSDFTGSHSIAAAKLMKADLDNDNAGGFKYAIRSVSLAVSEGAGGIPSTGAQKSGKETLPSGEIAGIVIGLAVVLIICLFLAVFVYRHKTRGSDELGFKIFDRFSLRKNFRKPHLAVPPSLSIRFGGSNVTAENIGASSQGFDNPMYGNNPLDNEKPLDLEMMPTGVSGCMHVPPPDDLDKQPSFENGLGFDNPLYDSVNVQESFFKDPTSVEGGDVNVDETLGKIHHKEA